MPTIFTKIINGEIPCYKVAENDEFIAFLDIMPIKKGHVLIVPKIEVDYIFDIEDDVLGRMMVFSKQVAKKIQKHFLVIELVSLSLVWKSLMHMFI